ncbi:hypothetical protein DS843_20400 [Roseomonas genomospecies 6]|uniref:Uncharacterized protein n=1 Tax=Roseomonas genomospecies 6 TaxID=214106 RepID=A0A9W7KR69_9PROT|nr:hypothetical protein DS843_20400 [Roseomonas genomospecies 6]
MSIARVMNGRPMTSSVSGSTPITSVGVWSIWTISKARSASSDPRIGLKSSRAFLGPWRRLVCSRLLMTAKRASTVSRAGLPSPSAAHRAWMPFISSDFFGLSRSM